MALQAPFQIFIHVDRLGIQPRDHGTTLFSLIASRHPFFKTSHTDRCLLSGSMDATYVASAQARI